MMWWTGGDSRGSCPPGQQRRREVRATSEYLERGACRGPNTLNRRRATVSSPWIRLNAAAQRSPASSGVSIDAIAAPCPKRSGNVNPRPCCVMSRKSRRRAAPAIAAAVAALSPAVKVPRPNRVETTGLAAVISANALGRPAAGRLRACGSCLCRAADNAERQPAHEGGADGQGRPQRARLVSLLRGSRKVSGDLAGPVQSKCEFVNETGNDWCRCSRPVLA